MAAARAGDQAITRFKMTFERYPNLKADAMFGRLMGELSQVESDIAAMRMQYNKVAAELNAQLRSIDGQITATFMAISLAPYYEPPSAARGTPVVDFTGERQEEARAAEGGS